MLYTATRPRAEPERFTSASSATKAASTASKRSHATSTHNSAARVSQFSTPGPAAREGRLERRRGLARGVTGDEAHHALRHRQGLARGPRRRARGEPRKHRARPPCPARVVEPGHHELALQPRGQRAVAVGELAQRPLEHLDRVDPPEQRRVGLGHLERDLGPLAGVVHQR